MENGSMEARSDLAVYTPEEVAGILRVSRRTLYSYLSNGSSRSAKIGSIWRITRQDIDGFLVAGTASADSAREARSGGLRSDGV